MDAYRKKIKTRINIYSVLVLLGVMLIVVNRFFGEHIRDNLDISDTLITQIHEATAGMIIGLMALVVFYIIRCAVALRNDEKLKKLYIRETDERTLFIYQKSGSIGMNISVAGLLIGALIAAYLNVTVSITLLGACLFVSLIRGFLKLFYRKKI